MPGWNCCFAPPTRAPTPLLEQVRMLQGKCHLSFPTGVSMCQEMKSAIWEQTNQKLIFIIQAGKSGLLPQAHLEGCGHSQDFAIQFIVDTLLVSAQPLQRAPSCTPGIAFLSSFVTRISLCFPGFFSIRQRINCCRTINYIESSKSTFTVIFRRSDIQKNQLRYHTRDV